MFELLMTLVGIHAQVTAAAAPLLERTLNALVEDIVEEALRCFRQVKKFGMGGMLRVGSRFPPTILSTIHELIIITGLPFNSYTMTGHARD